MVTISIDPHVHSASSYDARDSVPLLLEHASDIGLDGIVVTDHDRIKDSLYAAEIAAEYGLIGIPGAEISTRHGHVLGIGITDLPAANRPVKETVEHIQEQGGAAVIAHPFQRIRHGVRKHNIPDIVDAIETYNAWLFLGYRNRRAKTFAAHHDHNQIAGSDAHSVRTVGRARTEIVFDDQTHEDITADHIVDAIKNGHTSVNGRRVPIPRSATHYLMGAGKIMGMYVKRAFPPIPR